eukprot:6702825-Heterocapsa_arctica.AAC.1
MGPWCSPLPPAPVLRVAFPLPVAPRLPFPGLGISARACAPFLGPGCALGSRTPAPPSPLPLLPPP